MAPEHDGDDPGLDVFVETRKAFDFDLCSGFFCDLAAHTLLERLMRFEHAAGGCQWPLSRRRMASTSEVYSNGLDWLMSRATLLIPAAATFTAAVTWASFSR